MPPPSQGLKDSNAAAFWPHGDQVLNHVLAAAQDPAVSVAVLEVPHGRGRACAEALLWFVGFGWHCVPKSALSLTHDLLCVLSMDTWWNFGHELKKEIVVCGLRDREALIRRHAGGRENQGGP